MAVVFVFGLATFHYAATDEVGRRVAAVQLVASKIATSIEVASAFEVTLWRWGREFTAGGVAALVPGIPGRRARASSPRRWPRRSWDLTLARWAGKVRRCSR